MRVFSSESGLPNLSYSYYLASAFDAIHEYLRANIYAEPEYTSARLSLSLPDLDIVMQFPGSLDKASSSRVINKTPANPAFREM